MNHYGLWVAVALTATLSACAQESEEVEQPMPVEETVFADQVEALDRAKEQAREMEGRKQDLDAQLDAAEGGARDGEGGGEADGRRD